MTAVSVARQCRMVSAKDQVIMVNATGPENDKPARIQWEFAESDPSQQEEEDSNDGQDQEINQDTEFIDPSSSEERLLYQNAKPGETDSQYHFAMSGKSFAVIRQYFFHLLPRICVRGTVFARMSPDQKSQLVEHFQELGYIVGMCGDGANDCGALKAAHAGISLSEAEASVASPFTSKVQNIECVPTLIREGRAALVTAFGIFKYMALYSIIQFVSVLILYKSNTNLGDMMFLYVDLIITTTVAILMGYTAAYQKLVAKRPTGSLMSPNNIFSLLVHIILVIGFQVGAFIYLTCQDWFIPVSQLDKGQDLSVKDRVFCWETTVIFLVSSYQYLMLAFCFSKGPPYRKPVWTNVLFLIALVAIAAVNTWLLLYPWHWLAKVLQVKNVPEGSFIFRLILFALVIMHFIAATLMEEVVVPSKFVKEVSNAIRRKKGPKNKYKIIENALLDDKDWPPVGSDTSELDNDSFVVHFNGTR